MQVICIFKVYSGSTVLYRTFTFNDCPEAAKELLEEIDMARADLKRKGMKSLQWNITIQEKYSINQLLWFRYIYLNLNL